ncbi:MAG: TlpA family protein disulfide reductase [Algiphilus sp.]
MLIAATLLAAGPARAETIAVDDFDLQATGARLVYLDFWASWCAPCKASFPWMQQISDQFASQGLKIIAVNVDRDQLAAERFIEAQQPTFDIVLDPGGRLASDYGIRIMPTSFLLRPDGSRLSMHSGFRLHDRAELEAHIRRALDGPLVTPHVSEDGS